MFQEGELVLVAVSGGPDSMCLLDVLHRCRSEFGMSLLVVHLNHHMREQAPEDARMVRDYARSKGIETRVGHADVLELAKETGKGVEEAGRDARYRFFRSLRKKTGASKIALGHNLNDQAETVLMRLLRGSGTRGLSGIPPVNGSVVRPLIEVPRGLIEAYCEENGIPVMTDVYNLDLNYTRNRIRYETLPELARTYNPSLVDTLGDVARALKLDSDFLDELAAKAFQEHTCRRGRVTAVNINGLRQLNAAIGSRVIGLAWLEASGADASLGLDRALKVLSLDETPVFLPGKVAAVRERDFLVFYPEAPKLEPVPLAVPGETPIPELGVTVITSFVEEPDVRASVMSSAVSSSVNSGLWLEKEDVAFVDYSRCTESLVVRKRSQGDRFLPLGMEGRRQKLQDFFIQKHVPRFYRDFVPIVASGDKIVWVAGFRLDERFKVKENVTKVLRIEVRRELRSSRNCATI
jgi:tRNA(Ile)-lysidine synthase